MLFTTQEVRLVDRATKAWLYKGVTISDEVARLIAKDYGENIRRPDWDHSRFIELAYDGTTDLDSLIEDIDRELSILSSDFSDDVPEIRKLNALKTWAEGKK
ncbi:MAG: hypothetical protein IJI97_05830 [Clostridia bacterium]|nr:hypothetical protein [Clostridia bacterium]